MATYSEITYASFFSGIGGIDLTVRLAVPDARCVCYVEAEVPAAAILATRIEEKSLDDAPIWSDVRTFDGKPWRGLVDGIIGGFPCPDYSVAGRRKGIVGKHGQLWNDFRRCIGEIQPEWLYLENVPGIAVGHKVRRWRWNRDERRWQTYILPAGLWFVLGDLAALGFHAEWIRLSAAEVGAPHKRARWFCLAYRSCRGLRMLWESSERAGFFGRGNGHNGFVNIREQAANWPTPDANAMNDGESAESWRTRQSKLKQTANNGNGAGVPLAIRAVEFDE